MKLNKKVASFLSIHFTQKMKAMEVRLANFVDLYPSDEEVDTAVLTKMEVSKRVLIGLKVKSILHACPNPADSMFVMGMTGSHNAVGKFFGTLSSTIAKKAKCPVLLVPKGVKYSSISNILFASNYESAERKKLKQITDFAAFFNAGIHFIHVRGKNELEEYTATEELIYERIFEKRDPAFRFNLAAVEAPSIVEGINQYANTNDIDLVTIVKSRLGILESMFNKSITKKVAFTTKLPLLVLHLVND